MDSARFMTRSLRSLEWGEQVGCVLSAALQAVEPGAAIKKHLQRVGDHLIVGGSPYTLPAYKRVFLVGAGKASIPMGIAAATLLGDHLTAGMLITKEGCWVEDDQTNIPGLEIFSAGHPIPNERGRQATQKIVNLLSTARADDLVLCLISGGGSALLTDPVEGISLEDIQVLTASLLRCGANVGEINTLRKHVDRVKGGGLARVAAPATVISMILSDVVGDPLDMIASGPCLPDLTTFEDALAVLQRYHLFEEAPPKIIKYLQKGVSGSIPETPKPGDHLFDRTQNIIIGSGYQAAQAGLERARGLGWNSSLLTTFLQGEARQAGRTLAAIARQVDATGEPSRRPACLIAAGETTVTVKGGGTGGRNQELALAAVPDMAGIQEAVLVALATDGGDGPTAAAGAVVTGETLLRARSLGMEPVEYLDRNDAYHFFEPLDDLLITGPTQTNVNDLALLFLG